MISGLFVCLFLSFFFFSGAFLYFSLSIKKAPPSNPTHDDAVRAAVVRARDGAEALLAGSVPLSVCFCWRKGNGERRKREREEKKGVEVEEKKNEE